MALREDEDVAEAMGINLVATKLTAFAIGALFAGLAGTFLPPSSNPLTRHSFNFLVSINVLSLIIVGGMGSIPGVIRRFPGAGRFAGDPARVCRIPLLGLWCSASGNDAAQARRIVARRTAKTRAAREDEYARRRYPPRQTALD